MFSMPPATAMSVSPACISSAAEITAWAPEPHTRLTVNAGTETGRAAFTAACLAGFILLPACTTFPIITEPMMAGERAALDIASLIAAAPRSTAE